MFGKQTIAALVVAFAALGVAIPIDTAEKICETEICKATANELLHRSMNASANPCDSFYDYVCGNWSANNPIPENAGRWNTFAIRARQVAHEINDAVKAATESGSHSVKYLAQLYLECNDTKTLESRGTKPLLHQLDTVLGGWPLLGKAHKPTTQKWAQLFTELYTKTGVSPIYRMVVQYQRILHRNILMVGPGGTVAPPQILLQTDFYAKQIAAYREYIRKSAILLGASDDGKLTAAIDRLIHVETEIAKVLRDHPYNYFRKGTLSGLKQLTSNRVDWTAMINAILHATKSSRKPLQDSEQILSVNVNYLHDAAVVLDAIPAEELQNLFGWMLIAVFGPLTTHEFRHNQAVFRSSLTGVVSETSTSEYCYAIADAKLPFVIGRIYVDAHFTPEDKKEAVKMVKELKASFHSLLQSNTWLDAETRKLALEKLEAIQENIAYPDWLVSNAEIDHFHQYLSDLPIHGGQFLESAIELNLRIIRHSFDSVDEPLNHTQRWPMTPATVNAAYMPTENSITIPAAILKPPLFEKNRPFSMNYGGIGAIIGHEMTHGFDNMGRQFDLHGEQKNWWTAKTTAEFRKKATCFMDQYSAIIEPMTHLHLNGATTLGENIADNGGVKEGFRAFNNHETHYGKSEILPMVKFNAKQLLFVSYARNWCNVIRKEAMRNQIKSDPHPPDRYRVDVVLGNTPQFAEAFNCAVGTGMNPIEKCAVW